MTLFEPGDPVLYGCDYELHAQRGTVVRYSETGKYVFVQFERGGPMACHPNNLRRAT